MSGSLSTPTADPFGQLLAGSRQKEMAETLSPSCRVPTQKSAFQFLDPLFGQMSQTQKSYSSSSSSPHLSVCPRPRGDDSPLLLSKKNPFAFGSSSNLPSVQISINPLREQIEKLKEAYRACSISFYFSQISNAQNLTEETYKVLKISKNPHLSSYGSVFKTIKTSSFKIPFPFRSLENRVTPVVNGDKELLLLESKNPDVKTRSPKYVEIMKKMVEAQITPKVYFCLPKDNKLPETVIQQNGKVYSSFETEPFLDGTKMLVKRARGGDFTSYFERWSKTTKPEELDGFCLQLLNHVDRMHDLNVFHRDIKPENIVVNWGLDGKKSVYLIDFGFATDQPVTARDCGTRAYMAPELCRKHFLSSRKAEVFQKIRAIEIEPRLTDLYATGITLFEILTGKSFEAELEHHAKKRFVPDESRVFDEFYQEKQEAIDRFLDDPQRGIDKNKILVIKGFLRLQDPHDRMSIKEALRLWSSP
jgi:hypothetical protein